MPNGHLTMKDAAALLSPGMTVFIHGTGSEPRAFVQYLADHPQHLTGVHVIASFIPGINTVGLAALAPDSKLTTFMSQPALLDAITAGDAEALRLPYSSLPEYLAGLEQLDICFFQGRTIDADQVSTGITGELIPAACAKAERRCLFDNPNMPVPVAGCLLPADAIEYRVPAEAALVEYLTGDRTDDVSLKIAQAVAGLVNDGDTIQAGLGVIPGAVFACLHAHRELRIYSGMISDSVMALYAAGALKPDAEHVYGMALGSKALYEWLDGRAHFRVAPVGQTHNRNALAGINRYVTINSAVEVATDGSVNAEQLGERVISGPGGLPDYAAGGSRSAGGKSIIALPSANHRRGISRIVTRLANHDAPTLSADAVTHVVTEHGVAVLAGATSAQRIERLIGVADPAFRDQLLGEARAIR